MDDFEEKQAHQTEDGRTSGSPSVEVWDIAVRVFHWSLVVAVAVAWITGGSGNRIHEIVGFLVIALIAFRLFWGLAGTPYARFKSFVRSPRSVLDYLGKLKRLEAPRHLGHNPAGGAMIVVLLALLVLITATGYMQMTPQFFGVVWVENLHHYSANALVAIIPLHVLGVIVSSWLHQENLVGAMFSGRKKLAIWAPETPADRERRIMLRIRASEGLALLVVLGAAGAGYGTWATSGRTASVVAEDAVPVAPAPAAATAIVTVPAVTTAAVAAPTTVAAGAPVATPGNAAPTPAQTAAVAARSAERDRQDYVIGGPASPSRAWAISSGGRLYDNWFVSLNAKRPQTTHPSWPSENTELSGPETWRCKTCHGWDYLGRDGQNRSGQAATGVIGLQNAKTRDLQSIVAILGNHKHGFTDEMLPQDAKVRLALFVREGQHTIRNYITPSGAVRGNAQQGQAVYENVCAACHGFSGKTRRLGLSAAAGYKGPPLYIGTKAVNNPVEVLHKIRNGHPGAIMVSLRGFPMEHAVNVLAYAQTLPVD